MRIKILILMICALTVRGFSQSVSLPYYTGFDSPSEKAGWQQYRTGYVSSYGWGNSGKLYHDYNVGGNSSQTVTDWMVSPPMNFIIPGTVSMKVMAGGFSNPTSDNCEVWFSSNDPDPTHGTYVLIGNISFMPKGQWNDTAFNIPVTTDSGYIAFKYKTVGAAWMEYSIDSIWVSTPAGVNELKNSIDLAVYPNPMSSSVVLKLDSRIVNGSLALYNDLGCRLVLLEHISGEEVSVMRENLPSGLYFFTLEQDQELIAAGKLVIR